MCTWSPYKLLCVCVCVCVCVCFAQSVSLLNVPFCISPDMEWITGKGSNEVDIGMYAATQGPASHVLCGFVGV